MSSSFKLILKAIVQLLGWGAAVFALWQKIEMNTELHWGVVIGTLFIAIIIAGFTTSALKSGAIDSMLQMPFIGWALGLFAIVFMSLLFLPFSALWNIKNAVRTKTKLKSKSVENDAVAHPKKTNETVVRKK